MDVGEVAWWFSPASLRKSVGREMMHVNEAYKDILID